MQDFKEHNQTFFILLTSLSPDEYRRAGNLFNNNETKNCSIYYQQKLVDKFKFIDEYNEETYHLFQKENNFRMEIPDSLSPKLISLIIHYLYFKEVKALPFGEILNFLELAILFQIKDLQVKIINFMKQTIDTAKKAVFLRMSLYSFIRRTDSNISDSLKEVLVMCETFLLENSNIKEYLFLFASQYYSIYHDSSDIESDLFNGLEMMKKHKIDGKYKLKLLLLFKDRLCVLKNGKNMFGFKTFAKELIEKNIKLDEISSSFLIKSFAKLELNLNEFKFLLSNEKIEDLENEIKNINDLESLCNIKKESEVKSEKKTYNLNKIEKTNGPEKESIEIESQGEMKICLLRNEFEDKSTKRSIRNNILLVIGAVIIFMYLFSLFIKLRFFRIFKMKNGSDENVIQLKENFETKAFIHQKENENSSKAIQHQLLLLDNSNETKKQQEEKQWIKEAVLCLKEKEEREDEKNVLLRLIRMFKTIHQDHKKHFQYLAELLEYKTLNQLSQLNLLFRASEHNFSATKFHKFCDWKGPTISIFRSRTKKLFGGYASIPWHSSGFSPAPGSFLFSLDKQTKHIIFQNEDKAMYGNRSHGPSFGDDDLLLDYTNDVEPDYSNFGGTYSLPEGITFQSDEAQSYLAGSLFFGLEEYEVFGLETSCWQGRNMI